MIQKILIKYEITNDDVYNNTDNYNPKKKSENLNCLWQD